MTKYQQGTRVFASSPVCVGKEAGVVETVLDGNKTGLIYWVRLDKYPRQLAPFRTEDLEVECAEGGAHEWENEICVKCFESKRNIERNGKKC